MKNILCIFTRMSWLYPGIRSRLVKLLHFKNFKFTVDFFGIQYSGNTTSYIDRFVYYMGAYEIGILNLIKELSEKYQIKNFIDIGANVGHHSLFAATVIDKVDSFEPYPKVLEQFHSNIKNNSISNITVHEFGIGKRAEQLDYFEPDSENLGTGSFVSDFSETNKSNGLKLKIKEGSFLRNLDFEKAIIKIDTEGFESNVFEGLQEVLRERACILIIEVSDFDKFNHEAKSFILEQFHVSLIKNQFKSHVELVDVLNLVGQEQYFLLLDKRL